MRLAAAISSYSSQSGSFSHVIFRGNSGSDARASFVPEDIGAGGIEHPLAASVAGVYAGEHCHWVFVEGFGHSIGCLFHECGVFEVGHVVTSVFPGDGNADVVAWVGTEFLDVGASGDQDVISLVADGGACPVFSFHK